MNTGRDFKQVVTRRGKTDDGRATQEKPEETEPLKCDVTCKDVKDENRPDRKGKISGGM